MFDFLQSYHIQFGLIGGVGVGGGGSQQILVV